MRPHVVHWLDGLLPSAAAQLLAPTWFTCVGIAGVVGLFALVAIARRDRIETRVVASIVLWCYLAAVTAGIVVPMAIDTAEQLVATGALRVRWAGMTSFWGYLAGIGAVIAVCRANRIPLGRLGDLAAAPMGLALFCARIGCFLAGCDYGKVTSVPWAVRFPAGSPAWTDQLHAGLLPPDRADSLPVHPTQLYEAALGLLMVALALVLLRARMKWLRECNGRVFLVCAALYAIGRLAIESVRGDLGRGIYLGLSSGQIFSIVVLAVVSATWLATRRRAALIAVAAAALVLAVVEPREGFAQPAPQEPAPPEQPARPQQPDPAPQQPYPPPPPPPPAVQASAPATSSIPPIAVGVLVGIAVPINRRADQVPALAGVSISGGYNLGPVGVWLDFDDYMSNEAYHRSGLVSASVTRELGKWTLGARFGVGFTSVTFKDTAFAGATGSLVRLEGLAEYRFNSSWNAWARLTPFDLVTAADLGGSILTYQLRLGVAYRFGRSSAPAPVTPRQTAAPGS